MPGLINSKIVYLVSETLMIEHPEVSDVSVDNLTTFDNFPYSTDAQFADGILEEAVKGLI